MKEDLGRLFVPFQQVDSGLTRNYEGTGLGLSISKRLVTMLGGDIAVESEPGHGKHVQVPAAHAEGGEAREAKGARHRGQRAEPVPDELPPHESTASTSSLRATGARASSTARDVRAGSHPPRHPASGDERTRRRARAAPRSALRSVPIVAVTSYAMPGDREQVLAAGCTGYIEKPINPDTFLTQLGGFLRPERRDRRRGVAQRRKEGAVKILVVDDKEDARYLPVSASDRARSPRPHCVERPRGTGPGARRAPRPHHLRHPDARDGRIQAVP